MTTSPVNRLLARQDGVVSAQQALAAGLSRSAIDRKLSTGAWRTVGRGVYLSTDRLFTPAAQLRAAVLEAGEGACAYGPSAAWWHGLIDRAPSSPWVTVPAARRPRSGTGHVRRRDIHKNDVDKIRGLLVTSVPLTVLEAAVQLPHGSQFLDRALQRRTSLPILERVHENNIGRHGAARAGELLRVASEGGASDGERRLVRLVRTTDLRGWRLHVWSCGYEIDLAFEEEMVAIEVDGWAWHRDADRFQKDTERQNTLMNAGWHILRFTWHRIVDEPEGVLREIREALARRRPVDSCAR